MWIKRDFLSYLQNKHQKNLPVKVLKGPRQVGKTSLLDHLGTHKLVLFDDLGIRTLAQENPHLFFEQFRGPLILDEATLAPELFPEIKRRVDEMRRKRLKGEQAEEIDIWITGSNQTLLQKTVRESLAGRANYFVLNTLSVSEVISTFPHLPLLRTFFMRGGWPELYAVPDLPAVPYINDFIATFIEKDIVSAAGIEKRAAFSKTLQLAAGRVGQLFNASDIAKNVSVDVTTIQSWISLLEQNGILRMVQPYYTNLNQRLIKTPKVYFEDVGLAVRLQGWSAFEPLLLSPFSGHLFETLVLSTITRFFMNRGEVPEIYFLRSKDQVEVDFLVQLPNRRFLALEVKMTPENLSAAQLRLLDSVQLDIVEKWVVTSHRAADFSAAKVVPLEQMEEQLQRLHRSV